MKQPRKLYVAFLGILVPVTGCYTTDMSVGQEVSPACMNSVALAPPATLAPAATPDLPAAPACQSDDRPLPINLPAALKLANVQAVDIAAAAAQIKIAAAALEQAQVLWLPTVTFGSDYFRHDGIVQDSTSGDVLNDSHQGVVLGAGPTVNLDIGQAIFAPLVARQQLAGRQSDRQAASNDTLVAVTDAYFNVQQARGELAGAIEAMRRTEGLIARTRKLAPDIVPDLELFRAETELASRQKTELLAQEHWKVASAELLRVLRMDAAAQVEPVEPPQLRVELIDLKKPVDDLIPIGLTNRPELASQQAQVQATLVLLKQEKLRPLIPSLLVRGFSTPVAGTLGDGYAFYGNNGSLTTSQFRSDIDVQLLWRLDNLGFGNLAAVHQREANNHLAVIDLFRIQDRVAAEVAQAYAQAQLAARRVEVAERGLRSAVQSADKNLVALGQTKGAGATMVLLVRPQEVVSAIQALSQAYVDYYGAVADANRAQFRLYRALGQPAQCLLQDQRMATLCGPAQLPPAPPTRSSDEPHPAPAIPGVGKGDNRAPRP
jgi:outer membrane protein TolC